MKQEKLKVKGWTFNTAVKWRCFLLLCFHLLVHERWRLNVYCSCFDLAVGLDATDAPTHRCNTGLPSSFINPVSLHGMDENCSNSTSLHNVPWMLHYFSTFCQPCSDFRFSGNSSILPNTITSISTCLFQPHTNRGIYSLWPPDQ